MRHPQIVVLEPDGRLAELLSRDPLCQGFALREARRWETARKALAAGGPAVVVLHIGKEFEQDLGRLDRLIQACPEIPVVVVGEREHADLVGLAYDLGASLALFPSLPRQLLPAAVAGLMRSQLPKTPAEAGNARATQPG